MSRCLGVGLWRSLENAIMPLECYANSNTNEHQRTPTNTNEHQRSNTGTENEILVHSGYNSDDVVHHCFIDGSYEIHINSENEGSVDVTHTQSGSSILTCTVEEGSCFKVCEFNVGSAATDPIECDENNEVMISISVHDQEGCGEWHEEISWTILRGT